MQGGCGKFLHCVQSNTGLKMWKKRQIWHYTYRTHSFAQDDWILNHSHSWLNYWAVCHSVIKRLALRLFKLNEMKLSVLTHATPVSVGVSCCASVCSSVTSQCSTETAKCRITQTVPHDSPGTQFLMPKISAILIRCHPQWRCQMQVG